MNPQNRNTYSSFIQEYALPVFFQSWYLDAACRQGRWDVAIARHNGVVRGVWPYYQKIKYGQSYLTMPPLIPFLGPVVIRPTDMHKQSSWLSLQKAALTDLYQQLPPSMMMISQWRPEETNWLPLQWKGCQQSTRYTYRIDLRVSEEDLWMALSDRQRNSIRQAKKDTNVFQSDDISHMWPLVTATYERQSMAIPFTKETLMAIDRALHMASSRRIYMSQADGSLDAGVYIAHDAVGAYMMITGRKDGVHNGSVSLAIWEAIKDAKSMGLQFFDFEGSMKESIERYFRSFGGHQVPYFRVTRVANRSLEIMLRIFNRI